MRVRGGQVGNYHLLNHGQVTVEPARRGGKKEVQEEEEEVGYNEGGAWR